MVISVSIAVGALLGFLAGLGVGGGSLLMLWLTLVMQIPTHTARCINLMFFIPCSLCSSLFRLKQGDLPLKKLLLPMALGCAAAAGGSFLVSAIDTEILRKIFGILLLVTAARELRYRADG